jgi:UDP-glucuronate 4-epimerase
MNRALVTGAAGFIGSHLCEALLARGWTVRGVDSFNDFYDPRYKRRNIVAALEHPGFELIRGDLSDLVLDDILDGVDAVAHLAGEPGVTTSWGPAFARYVDRNIMATQRLLEAVSRLGARPFVYASSSSVYGTDADALRARGEPRPKSPYGVSKLAAEALVGAYSHSFGIPATSLRYFSVYGPRQRPDMAAHRFIESMLDGRPITIYGDGSQVRDYSYVADVVDATIRSLSADLPLGAVLDIASGSPVDVNTLIATLQDLLPLDDATVERVGERRGDVERTAGRIDLTRERLGWSPRTDLQSGLAEQVAWHVRRRQHQPALDESVYEASLASFSGSAS